jgi:hypothetical protein
LQGAKTDPLDSEVSYLVIIVEPLVKFDEYLAMLDLHFVFGQWFLGGRIDRLPGQQVEPGQVKRAGDFLSYQESGREIGLFMRTGPIPGPKLSF